MRTVSAGAAAGEARRLTRFARASARIASADGEAEVVRVFLAEAVPFLDAVAGCVGLVRGEVIEIAGEVGFPPGPLEAGQSFALSGPHPLSRVVASRGPVFCGGAEERDARWPLLRTADFADSHAIAVLPLLGRYGVLGAIALGYAEDRSFGTDDRTLLRAIAAQCASALERTQLYAAERRARERTERLQRFTERLAPALTTEEVLEVALDKILVAAKARGATFATPAGRRRVLTNVQWAGLPRRLTRQLDLAASRAPTALAEAYERRRPIWIGDRGEWADRFPASAAIFEGWASSLAVLPIADGEKVFGAVEVLFERESAFRPDERTFLLAIAGQTAQALDRARAYEEQRHIATTLQERLLPKDLPAIPGAQVAAVYRPAGRTTEVGGDFYDAFESGERWVLVIGDVCGKGVEAAGFTSQCRNTLRVAALSDGDASPGSLLRVLNRSPVARDMDFASVACVIVRRRGRGLEVTAASAGHPPILIRRRGGLVEGMAAAGPLIGIFDDAEFLEATTELADGDLLALYTDGITEARARGHVFGDRRLRATLARLPERMQPRRALARIAAAVSDFQGDALPSDDVAMLALGVGAVRSPRRGPAEHDEIASERGVLRPRVGRLVLMFPALPGQLSRVRSAMRQWLDALPACDRRDDIVAAVNEAATNAVEHAYLLAERTQLISIEADLVGAELTVVVVDTGSWRPRRPRGNRGRGTSIMEALADALELRRSASGTEVRLRWHVGWQENSLYEAHANVRTAQSRAV